jgi:hypothetical protein
MSEPHKDETSPKQAEAAGLDATTAAAALALAVKSAEQSGGGPAETASDKIRPAFRITHRSSPAALRHAMQAGAIAIVIGIASAAGSHTAPVVKEGPHLPDWAATALSGIRQNQEDVARLSGDVRTLMGIVEAMRENLDLAKAEAAGQQRAMVDRVERIERAAQDTTAAISHLLDASGRIERVSTEAGAKLVALSGRLDDIEKQGKAAAVKPAANAAAGDGPAQTGSVPETKAPAKEKPVDSWVLRDVFAGVALVESRDGYLREVVPGSILPKAGRVEAIERRGRTWVVVTQKGIIGAPSRWQ